MTQTLPSNTNTSNTVAAKLAASKQNQEKPKSLVVAEKFQEYRSSRSAMRLITTGGIKITFTNFRLITQTKEVIEYLDDEITKKSIPGITKGELLTLDEVNPMQTLRREMEAKVRAEMAEEAKSAALGKSPDMGETANRSYIAPLGSNSVAN